MQRQREINLTVTKKIEKRNFIGETNSNKSKHVRNKFKIPAVTINISQLQSINCSMAFNATVQLEKTQVTLEEKKLKVRKMMIGTYYSNLSWYGHFVFRQIQFKVKKMIL